VTVFLDTSAAYALLDRDDANHLKAKRIWQELLQGEATLVTTNYILVETFALVGHRLGASAVRAFQEDVLPVVAVEWIQETTHRAAVSALLAAARRTLSLVDCTSFETMRSLGTKTAFAFDRHFAEQGFRCLP
jgi:predicted nucleic acid-binding protein